MMNWQIKYDIFGLNYWLISFIIGAVLFIGCSERSSLEEKIDEYVFTIDLNEKEEMTSISKDSLDYFVFMVPPEIRAEIDRFEKDSISLQFFYDEFFVTDTFHTLQTRLLIHCFYDRIVKEKINSDLYYNKIDKYYSDLESKTDEEMVKFYRAHGQQ